LPAVGIQAVRLILRGVGGDRAWLRIFITIIYHNTVRTALEKDGWTITDDPLTLNIGERSVFVDLGAEKLLTAEKQGQK
jgi:XisH protein